MLVEEDVARLKAKKPEPSAQSPFANSVLALGEPLRAFCHETDHRRMGDFLLLSNGLVDVADQGADSPAAAATVAAEPWLGLPAAGPAARAAVAARRGKYYVVRSLRAAGSCWAAGDEMPQNPKP